MTWLDCATPRPIANNYGGRLPRNLGLILHHAVAVGSLFDHFNDPASQVSTHFWVSRSGEVEQYVSAEERCWGGMSLNESYLQVETEGCNTAPHDEPMTDAMRAALGTLYREGAARFGWPPRLAEADGEPGFGIHKMAVATACPCDVRANERGPILALAGGAVTYPSTTDQGENMLLQDPATGGYWAASRDGAVFAYDGAPFLGGANGEHNPHGWPCVGIAAFDDRSGPGYCLGLLAAPGDVRRYRYPRDGTAA